MEEVMKNQMLETLKKNVTTIESYLKFELNEIQEKIQNLGKIDLNVLTERILSSQAEGETVSEEDIVYIIKQVVLN